MSLHNGHRERLKARFLKDGLDGFEEHQALELLLFYCIPRRDTNEIAHRLIKRFGSLSRVIEAPVSELQKVEGVGRSTAIYLSMIKDFSRYYQVNSVVQNELLQTTEECCKYLLPFFKGRTVESVFLLSLDAKCMVLNCRMIGEGSINSAGVSVRDIVQAALADNATSVVLAHNHPSGIAIPSMEDAAATKMIAQALKGIDVCLVDHVIVVDSDYTSMALSSAYSRFLQPND